MTLTGPELDLLQEVLAEDPSADIYLDVARALIDRGEARQASAILRRALEHGAVEPEAASLLVRAAAAASDFDGVRAAVKVVGENTVLADPTLARVWALTLDHFGELGKAAALATTLLGSGTDGELQAIIDRSQAPPPDPSTRGQDPYLTASRAEAYVESGRPDLAVRVLRRILARRRGDSAIHARLLQMRAVPREARPWVDDLSEEYWATALPSTGLAMPEPRLLHPAGLSAPLDVDPDDEETNAGAPQRRLSPLSAPVGATGQDLPPEDAFDDDDHEDATTVVPRGDLLAPPSFMPSSHMQELDEDDLDEEATISVARGMLPPLTATPAALQRQAAPDPSAFDPDDERTDLRRPPARELPGAEALRSALQEDRHLDDDDDEDAMEGGDPEDIIQQARAIERAADRKRRSLLRKP